MCYFVLLSFWLAGFVLFCFVFFLENWEVLEEVEVEKEYN